MSKKKLLNNKGSYTLEYAILIPIIFVCVFVCILLFLILYQKTLIQNLAEETVQSISRQWGYKPLPTDQLTTGVYKRDTYESREVYWHLKLWNSKKKEEQAESQILMAIDNLGVLKPHISKPKVDVIFKPGIPSEVVVKIQVAYQVPGISLIKLIDEVDYLIIAGEARSAVYDSKDMINTSDYVYQIIRETKFYQDIMAKIETLKGNLSKIIN